MRQTRTFARFTSTYGLGNDEPSTVVLQSIELGDVLSLAGNTALILDDAEILYVLASGEADLFYVRQCELPAHDAAANGASSNGIVSHDAVSHDAASHDARRYVGTLRAGDVVMGAMAGDETGNGVLLAVGFGGAQMRRVPIGALADESNAGTRIARALACGIAESIGRAMYRATVAPALPVEAAMATQHFVQSTAITSGADVVWLWLEHGELSLGGEVPFSHAHTYVPLARGMWITIESEHAAISISDTMMVLDSSLARTSLNRAWATFLTWTSRWFDQEDRTVRSHLVTRIDNDRALHAQSIVRLAEVLDTRDVSATSVLHNDPLLDACAIVFAAARIPMRPLPPSDVRGGFREVARHRDPVAAIAGASFVRHRRVTLNGDWWHLDAGPLLGFVGELREPVALLPSPNGGYTMQHAITGKRTVLNDAVARTINPTAFTFYRPLPPVALTLSALGKLVISDTWPDLKRVVLLAVVSALLGLALPIVTGKMFSDVIPSADMTNATTLFASLVAIALGSLAFELMRGLAVTRAEGRSNAVLQAAVVDRLLSLRTQFFRGFSVGDLASRAEAVNAVRQLITGAAVNSLLGGALALTSVAFMITINAKLGLIALAAIVVGAAVTLASGAYTLRYERRRQAIAGSLSSLVFELLGGVAKLHVAAAESRMFAIWTTKFRELKLISMRAGFGAAMLTAFNDVLPIVAAVVVYAIAADALTRPGTLSTGDFIAFSAAFGAALAAGTSVSNVAVSLLNVVPLLERAAPILAAVPEIGDAKPDPGAISGRIELSHVSFGYVADAPPIIDDISLEMRPGEFVAFVGPSGAGKSTILRLLLGFEQPSRGAVYYDGKDLASVDISAIRRQTAVVLQQSRLLAGDIYSNIVGAAPLSMDDAWRAAELAGLTRDIKAMPMGMHTVVTDGGSTLSGGQRQRLLIARALARNPRIVLFDEATSALDNRSQEIVTQSLERLQSTRIVIAHRLTTVMRADRIFVMDHGRIVQEGRYEELVEAEGLFKQLAERQLV